MNPLSGTKKPRHALTPAFDNKAGASASEGIVSREVIYNQKAGHYGYMHSHAFFVDQDNEHLKMREAREDPDTGLWVIQDVTIFFKPSTRDQESLHYSYKCLSDLRGYAPFLSEYKYASFAHALEKLAVFENDNLGHNKNPVRNTPSDKYHFKTVALHEGIALDIDGRAHPTFQGRPVTSGIFPIDLKQELKKALNSGNKPAVRAGTKGLEEGMTRPQRLQASHIENASKATLEEWTKGYGHLREALDLLVNLQDLDFASYPQKQLTGSKKGKVYQEDLFFEELDQAENCLCISVFMQAAFDLMREAGYKEETGLVVNEEEHRSLVYHFHLMRLTYHISHAKNIYQRFLRAGDHKQSDQIRGLLDKKCEDIYRLLGLSGNKNAALPVETKYGLSYSSNPFRLSIKDIQAEIIAHDSKITLGHKAHKLAPPHKDDHEIHCYFFPEALAEFVSDVQKTLNEIEKQVNKNIELERERKLQQLDKDIHRYADAYREKYGHKNIDMNYAIPADVWYAGHLRSNPHFTHAEIPELLMRYKAPEKLCFDNAEVERSFHALDNVRTIKAKDPGPW